MNHSLYSADRQTHRRIIGSAFVLTATFALLGALASAKRETQPAESSMATLRAGIPVAVADGRHLLIR
jgi:hypothetical protein